MLARKCPKCGAVWYTALPKCAFCGIEGEEVPTSTHTGRLPDPAAPAPEPEPEKPPAAVAVADPTPVPATSPEASARASEARPAPPAEPPLRIPEPPPPVAETRPAGPDPSPAPGTPASPRAEAPARTAPERPRPDPSILPPAPRVPSSIAPLVFGLLGLAAWVLLPVAAIVEMGRIAAILGHLAGAILLPFAPLAWFAGRRYEDRCVDLGFQPAALGRAGRMLGMTVTILISLEGSVLSFLAAYRLISAGK